MLRLFAYLAGTGLVSLAAFERRRWRLASPGPPNRGFLIVSDVALIALTFCGPMLSWLAPVVGVFVAPFVWAAGFRWLRLDIPIPRDKDIEVVFIGLCLAFWGLWPFSDLWKLCAIGFASVALPLMLWVIIDGTQRWLADQLIGRSTTQRGDLG